MRRAFPRVLAVVMTAALLLSIPATHAFGRARWKIRIDRATGGRALGVIVRIEGRTVYAHKDRIRRIPASNEKLLLTMALFDALSPGTRLSTTIAASDPVDGVVDRVVEGDLWMLGRGDPTITDGGRVAKLLPFKPTRIGRIARRIKKAGVQMVEGSVMGSIGYFSRDWFAPGWKPAFPVEEVPLPTALAFDGNVHRGDHITDPERRAAAALSARLRKIGVRVKGTAGAGRPPGGLDPVVKVFSAPLRSMCRWMNRQSSNFFAEMLGKRLGVERYGAPGTIEKGADAIASRAERQNVALVAEDSSGLSYSNRVSPRGVAKLLTHAESQAWEGALRNTLARAGQGTLEHRLAGVRMRAKTGTLDEVSALSGWVWLDRRDRWAAFSIMSRGMAKSTAAGIEDRIVRIVHKSAR